MPTTDAARAHHFSPNLQDGKSALVLAVEVGRLGKAQLAVMQALLETGASITENVRKALLRGDFWHRFVEKDASAAVAALVVARSPDLADVKDEEGRPARLFMSIEVKKVRNSHDLDSSTPR